MQKSVKILVIGPQQSGKSSVANFVSERSQEVNPNYMPTKAVRILEFEKEAPQNAKRPNQEQILVQLWDVSGDQKYSKCWQAIQKDTQGIILVYNAENPKHQTEIEQWVHNFPKKIGIPASQCCCFAHHLGGRPIKGKTPAPKGAPTLQPYDTSIESGTETILPSFDKFFQNLMVQIYKKEDEEENKLIE